MKTTLVIDDKLMTRLKQEAARRGTTISKLVEEALRSFLGRSGKPESLPPLPTFNGGGSLVDIADREALYDAMDEE